MKSLTATFALLLLTVRLQPTRCARSAGPPKQSAVRRRSQFVVEPPTLICLGFEWEISGDENRNATVAVTYRRSRTGLPRRSSEHSMLRRRPRGPGRLEAGVAAAADGRRADLPRALHRAGPVRREHPRPRAGYRVRSAPDHEGSGRRERAGRADGQGPHARGAQSGHRRARAARLPARAGAERKRSRTSRG